MKNKNVFLAIAILLVSIAVAAVMVGRKSVSPATAPTMNAGVVNLPVAEADSYGLRLPPAGNVAAPAGRQVYEISQAGNPLPIIVETVIDPPAVHVGNMQHLEALVSSPSPITKVYAVSRLDSKDIKVPLFFVQNETRGGVTYGRYAGDWKVEDTHDTLYVTAFFAEDSAGHVNHVEHAWSDTCPGVPVSGSGTLSSSCTVLSLDGIQGGNLTIPSGVTLSLNAEFDFTSGNSIVISNGGSIAIGSGGVLKKGIIYMRDTDLDHWPADATQYTSVAVCNGSEGGGCIARSSLTTYTSDCNDNNASLNSSCGGSSGGGICCQSSPHDGNDTCICDSTAADAASCPSGSFQQECAYVCNDAGCGVACCD